MMVGIFFAERIPGLSWPWVGALVGIFVVVWIVCPRRIYWSGLAISSLGVVLAFKETRIRSENDLRVLIGNTPRLVTLEGTIASVPLMRAIEDGMEAQFRTHFVLSVSRIRNGSRWRPAVGRVAVRIDAPSLSEVHQGVSIQITGALRRPESARLPGGFDYRRYLRLQRIYYEIQREAWEPHVSILARDRGVPLPQRFQAWARSCLSRGQNPESRSIRLVWAMVLGWRTWLTADAKDPFMRSGTLHLFAISGLHVALIAGFMVVIAKAIRIPRRAAASMIIPLIWFYTLATGAPASAIRASTVATIVLLGRILDRPPDALNSVGLAAILLLSWEPLQLFQAGFQLSFTVVVTLLVLYPRLEGLGLRFFSDEDLVPIQLRSPLRRMALRLFRRLWSAMSVSLAAWLGSLPLIATYFNLVTPLGVVANLVLIPLASLTMASAMMSLLMGSFVPGVSHLANSSAWFWMETMIRSSGAIAEFPGAALSIGTPPVAALCIYYLTLLSVLTISEWRAAVMRLMVGAVAISGIYAWNENARRETTELNFLPTTRGEAIFIDAPGKDWDLQIDGGPKWSAQRYVMPFLESFVRDETFPNFLLTHGDKEHVEAAAEILKKPRDTKVFISPLRFRSSFYRQLIDDLSGSAYQVERVTAGNELAAWTVLFPEATSNASPADAAPLVLLGQINGFKILLLSDLSRDTQKELLNRDPALEVDLLSLNLPSDMAEANQFVLQQLNPRVIIVTGSDTGFGERWVRLLADSFSKTPTRLYFTGTDGLVTVKIRQRELQLETMRTARRLELIPRSN